MHSSFGTLFQSEKDFALQFQKHLILQPCDRVFSWSCSTAKVVFSQCLTINKNYQPHPGTVQEYLRKIVQDLCLWPYTAKSITHSGLISSCFS